MADQNGLERPIVLEVRGITKRFPGVIANNDISLRLYKGETLALLGENGAGKSTLMNILYGLYQQDEGDIFINGRVTQITSPHAAIQTGIGMVHQHFQLVPIMTVAENIMLGQEVTKWRLFLNRHKASEHILAISRQYGLALDPDALVADLPVGTQQRVEIVKALYRNADILILDEPTAVLTPQESDDLFRIMRSLTAQGKSIIFITHKLREVLEIADRIIVLRNGRVVGETIPRQSTSESLAALMVGREVLLHVEKAVPQPQDIVLEVTGLCVFDDRQQLAVDNLEFYVRAGETLGIAGVQGNGQTELVAALTGLRPAQAGCIRLSGHEVTCATPRTMCELGVAHIPEDRQREGLVKSYPLTDNAVLEIYYQEPFAHSIVETILKQLARAFHSLRAGVTSLLRWMRQRIHPARIVSDSQAIEAHAWRLVEEFGVRTPDVHVPVSTLSGGNQQKLIVAREFTRPIRLLIASQPTRGIDVGSIEFIHKQIIRKRDEGCAVLLVSAELDEILAISDRIAVMYRGKIVATIDARQTTREELGLLMAGYNRDTVSQPSIAPGDAVHV